MVYLKALETIGVTDLQSYLESHALENIALSELLSSMLVTSDEDATSIIQQWTFSHINYQNVLSQWGISHTWINPRRSTAEDMARSSTVYIQAGWHPLRQGPSFSIYYLHTRLTMKPD